MSEIAGTFGRTPLLPFLWCCLNGRRSLEVLALLSCKLFLEDAFEFEIGGLAKLFLFELAVPQVSDRMVATEFEVACGQHCLKHIEHIELLLVLLLTFLFGKRTISQHGICEVCVLFDQVFTSDHYLEVDEAPNLFIVPLKKVMHVDHSLSEFRPSIVQLHFLEIGL